jgi:hypothetical protein
VLQGFVLPNLDSNQDKQIQNLLYYHYTIGQWTSPNGIAKLGFFRVICQNNLPLVRKKVYPLILCYLLLALPPRQAAAQTAQPTQAASQPIQSAFHLLDSIFNRPRFLFETLEPDIPADMATIILRFNNAIATNQQWFNEYRNKYSGVPLPYDPRFGITAAEYGRILHLQSVPPPLSPVDSQQVTVLKDAGTISFVCSNNENRLLNYLFIDPTHHLLGYGGDTIPFVGPARTAANSPYGQWQGFSWHLEKTEAQSVGDTTLLTARVVEVNIGVPSEGGKTFIRITYQSIQGSTPSANMELLGYIR